MRTVKAGLILMAAYRGVLARALLACGLGAAIPQSLLAADEAKPSAPSFADVLAASGVQLNGYVDAAYSYLSGSGLFTSGVTDRVFDTEPNSFNLHQAALIAAYQPKDGFGALVNLTAGRDARVIKSFDTSTNDFDVTQAFVQYAHGSMTIIAGKYVTLAGAEVINSTSDLNYSRSILFGYAIPFAHTGVRATFALSDAFSLIVGVNNGWDQLKDANKQKTAELAVAFIPSKAFSLFVQGYSGTEQVGGFTDTVNGKRDLIDLVATFNATDQLSFILNYDYATQEHATSLVDGTTIKAEWSGAAAYVNFRMNDQWRVSLRGEYFDDQDGYRTGVIQKWKEATLTLAYLPTKSMEIRTEVRGDRSDVESFVDSLVTGSTKDNQYSLGLEGIFKF
ncbi:MAG TPA: outer membrane beta-barrel protein [Steroidobacteraceae bacterium]|nr:outer membrane beta-barrel protein [Steroidobacteraceae bacterium]